MSDLPPNIPPTGASMYGSAPPPRVSGASVTSLVLGILLCIPFVTSLGAIIFAIVGIRATSRGMRRGKGLAIAGLILGIVGLLGWAGAGGVGAMLINGSAAPRAVLHDFADKLVAGDTAGALAESDSVITQEDFNKLHDMLVPLGAYRDLTCYGAAISSGAKGETCVLTGSMHFAGAERTFSATLIKDPTGAWKVYGFRVL